MMLRGPVVSKELMRSLLNSFSRRGITAAPIRYVEEKKERKKTEGMLSWLKDVLKSGDNIGEDQFVLSCSVAKCGETTINCKSKNRDDIYTVEQLFPILETRENFQPISKYPTKLYNSFSQNESHRCTLNGNRSFVRQDLLNLVDKTGIRIREIMGCTPRNTKPPIREPNMPEKHHKRDDKKDKKKKKKPVIRMERRMPDDLQNNPISEGERELHNNIDVNFRHQTWGIRIPEEVEWNSRQMSGVHSSVQNTENASCHAAAIYNANTIQAVNRLQLTMSSMKDSDKKEEVKKDLHCEELMKFASPNPEAEAKDKSTPEDSKETLKAAKKDNHPVDEDYNISGNTNLDAEILAWKDLVLKSKVPMDPSKEEFLETQADKQMEMLSIRPEPPQPKLDVRAIPSSSISEMEKDEEDDSDSVIKDLKAAEKTAESKRGATADVQKVDSKKLHTVSSSLSSKLHVSFWRRHFSVNQGTADNNVLSVRFSTNADNGNWGRIGQSVSKGNVMEEEMQMKQERHHSKSRDMDDSTISGVDNISEHDHVPTDLHKKHQQLSKYRQESQDMDPHLSDNFDRIEDKDMDVTMNHAHRDDYDMHSSNRAASSQKDARRFEADDQMRASPDSYQRNTEYSPYEDDYYPAYETAPLDTVAEKSVVEKSQKQSPRFEASMNDQQQTTRAKKGEIFPKGEKPRDQSKEQIVDGNYIKVPGDPYPYSKEYFYKWNAPVDDIQLGQAEDYEKTDSSKMLNINESNRSTDV